MSDYSGVGVFDPTGFLEIGWWIAKRFWGQGYATEAARCALEHAFMKIRFPQLESATNLETSLPLPYAQDRVSTKNEWFSR